MSNKPDLLLTIIIVSFNTAELTQQTIESIFNSLKDQKKWQSLFEIVVIDNCSSDESVAYIKRLAKKYSNLRLIESGENLGFAKANNFASKMANGKYLLLLNSDTIVQPNALEKLVSGAAHHQLAVATPTLLNLNHTHQAQGGDLPSLFSLINHYWLLDDLPLIGRHLPSTQKTGQNFFELPSVTAPDGLSTTFAPFGWVGGTAMLVEKSWWDRADGFDEKIFMYGEDIELCQRINDLGGKVGIITDAKIIHLGSASSSSKNAILGEIKGYLYFFRKHKSTWQLNLVKLIIKGGIILRITLFSWLKRDQQKVAIYKEAWKFIK